MEQYTNIQEDLQIIEDLFQDVEFEKLCEKMDLTQTEYLGIKNGEIDPTKQQLENIYNFAYNRGLYINEIHWQEALDKYRAPGVDVVSHGARTYIKGDIRLDVSGDSNDFSDGFYMGQDIAQGGMFVGEEPNSSLYILTFNPKGLKRAQFNVSVDWMLAVCWYRDKIPQYADAKRVRRIRDKVDNCDYVLAPIADNKMFEVIDAFSNKEITDLQCLYALSATHLGYQYVLKKEACLSHVDIKEHMYFCSVEKSLYNKQADVETNTSMNKAIIARNRYKDDGVYIDELLGD